MGLRLKFNLVLIVVFLAGFAAAGWVSRQLLVENARDEVIREARLMMEAALSVRTWFVMSMIAVTEPAMSPCGPSTGAARMMTVRRRPGVWNGSMSMTSPSARSPRRARAWAHSSGATARPWRSE